MSTTLSVSEKYSRHWPAVSIISGVAALFAGLGFVLSNDVLLEGYLRLAAFIFFAICLLSLFKLRDGKIEMIYSIGDNLLSIEYHQKNHILGQETVELSDISGLKITALPNRSLYNDLFRSDRCVRIQRKDSGWIYLNEVNGRVIPMDDENSEKVRNFLKPFITQKSES